MREYEILACEDATGKIVRKFVYTKLELTALGANDAENAGFVISEDGTHYIRDLTEEIQARELREEPDLINHGIFNEETFPDPTLFKEVWVLVDGVIKVDMPKARIIQENKIRAARDIKWKDFDERYTTAQRDGLDLTVLQTERQMLKDIPNNAQSSIDIAITPEILKAIWPTELN